MPGKLAFATNQGLVPRESPVKLCHHTARASHAEISERVGRVFPAFPEAECVLKV